ncbi:MAG: type II secretion system protein N [Rhodospirillaceae bacterium]
MNSLAFRLSLAFFSIVFLGAAVLTLPASFLLNRLPLEKSSLSYTTAYGTAWQGGVKGAVLGPLSLGHVIYRVSPVSALTGSVRANIFVRSAAVEGQANVTMGASRLQVSDARATFDVSKTTLLIPISGRLDVSLNTLDIASGRCVAADGDATITGRVQVADNQSISLTGPIVCKGDAVTSTLSGALGTNPMVLEIVQGEAGTVNVLIKIEGLNEEQGLRASVFGFVKTGSSYEFAQTLQVP